MAFIEDLQSEVQNIFRLPWSERNGTIVPEPEDLKLGNDGVVLDAVCLYADMARSTQLVARETPRVAAECYKAFLHCASKLIRTEGGVITSFDGDRVMGVFIGEYMNTRAVRCALKIHWAVVHIVNPSLRNMYHFVKDNVGHSVGVDTSKLLATRTGIRGSNDIVWVGRAANYAAKLCEMREADYATWITPEVHYMMAPEVKRAGNPPRDLWEAVPWTKMGNIPVHRSRFWWSL